MSSYAIPFPARFLEKTAHIHTVVNVCNFRVTRLGSGYSGEGRSHGCDCGCECVRVKVQACLMLVRVCKCECVRGVAV